MDWLVIPTHSFDLQPVDCGAVWAVWDTLSKEPKLHSKPGLFYNQARKAGSNIPPEMLSYCFRKSRQDVTKDPVSKKLMRELKKMTKVNPSKELVDMGYWFYSYLFNSYDKT